MATTAIVEAEVRMKDFVSGEVDKINRKLGSLEQTTKKSSLGFGKLSLATAAGGAINRAFSAGLREMNEFISSSIRASSEFNQAFTESTAIMGNLSDTLRNDMIAATEEVARTTTFTATEAAKAYFFLASAGLDAAASIGALPTVSKFAQAGAFDLAQATDLLTDAQSALGLTIKGDVTANMMEMTRVSDVLVKANTLANATVEQFSQALTNKAGAALRQVNKEIEEGVAVLAVFADQGVKGAEAGTALNIVMRDLQTKALENADAFRANNIAVFDSEGAMRNMADIIEDLEVGLGSMSVEQKKATLAQLGFTDKSIAFVSSLIGMSDQIRFYEENLKKAGGTTDEIADKQLQSFASQAKLVSNEIDLLKKELGNLITENDTLRDALVLSREVFQSLTEKIKENQTQLGDLIRTGFLLFLEVMAQTLIVGGKLIEWTAKAVTWNLKLELSYGELAESLVRSANVLGSIIPGLRQFGQARLLQIQTENENTRSLIAGAEAAENAGKGFQKLGNDTQAFTQRLLNNAGALKDNERITEDLVNMRPFGGVSDGLEAIQTGVAAAVGGIGDLADESESLSDIIRGLGDETDDTSGSLGKLTKEQKAAQAETKRLEDAIDSAAASLGRGGLRAEAALMNAALGDLSAAGEDLSQQGLKSVVAMFKDLKSQGEPIPPQIQAIIDKWNDLATRLASLPLLTTDLDDAAIAADNFGTNFEGATDGIKEALRAAEPFMERFREELIATLVAIDNFVAGAFGIADVFDELASQIGGKAGDILGGVGQSIGGVGEIGSGIGKVLSGDIIGGIKDGIRGVGNLVGGLKDVFGGLFGKSDLVKDAARDLGANISRELADSLRANGTPIQLALAQIFEEGGFADTDTFAREIGDIFSGLSRGEFSEIDAIKALEESIPLLIENFGSLGAAGQMEVQRIIDAAKTMGIEFEGLNELIGLTITEETLANMGLIGETNVNRIRQAAAELGVEFEFLKELIDDTFAPETLEGIAEKFNLSTEEARQLAKELGINVQTELERLAASVGLTAGEFNALGAALEEQFGIPADKLKEFLEDTGLTAQALADKLGVEVGDGLATTAAGAEDLAGTMNDSVNPSLQESVLRAQELETALRGAADASGNISFDGIPGAPAGMAEGGFVPATRGGSLKILAEGGEGEFVVPQSKVRSFATQALGGAAPMPRGGSGGGGGGMTIINFDFSNSILSENANAMADKIAPAVEIAVRKNKAGTGSAVVNVKS